MLIFSCKKDAAVKSPNSPMNNKQLTDSIIHFYFGTGERTDTNGFAMATSKYTRPGALPVIRPEEGKAFCTCT